VLLALAGLAAMRPRLVRQVFEKTPLFLGLLAALAMWAALSATWSPFNGATYLKAPATLVFGLLFARAAASEGVAPLSLAGAAAALCVLVSLLGIEALFDAPLNTAVQPTAPTAQINQNPARGGVVMLALLWPVLAWLVRSHTAWRWPAVFAIAIGAGLISLQFGQLSTAVGFAAGLAFFAAGFVAPRLAVMAPACGLAIWMLLAPFVTPLLFANQTWLEALPHSSLVRIGIWRHVSARILEQPWIGHGLDAGRATTELATYDGETLRAIPVHPHSASLQIWYDLGAVGAILAGALILLAGLRLSRVFSKDKPTAAAAAAVLAMFGLMANIGWSLWQEWWMATLMLAATLVAALGAKAAKA
jgi:O-antigen ligase